MLGARKTQAQQAGRPQADQPAVQLRTGRFGDAAGGAVPTPEQEQLRAESRQHDQLVAMRKAIGAQGRALVLSQGYGMMKGAWWRPKAYRKWAPLLPEWIRTKLEVWQATLRLLDAQIAQRKKELAQSNKEALPKGFGAQSMVQLDREIGDYHRFANGRKVGCFGGCSPGAFYWNTPTLGLDYQSGFAPDPDSDHRDGVASGAFPAQLSPGGAVA